MLLLRKCQASAITTVLILSGGVMLGMLNILEPYNIAETGCLDSSANTHALIEAMKFAFGARSEVTDPAFAKNMTRINEFYTKQWADEIRPKFDKVCRLQSSECNPADL